MSNTIRSIKGTHDILPEDSKKWQQLESTIRKITHQFGYEEIRTPIFEKTGLFSRSVGEDTDIVSKEMYSWEDRDGSSLTLRPELTAPVVRSFVQNNLGGKSPLQRLFYIGPLFRRERPQKGRQRQFHQCGIEAFGSPHAEQDAEVISLAYSLLTQLGLTNLNLKLNSIGSPECRAHYRNALQTFLKPFYNELSETSQKRFESNPLRILDTKAPHEINIIKNAPNITDFLTDEDQAHFNSVQTFLNQLNIPFTCDPTMVRGLDYYTRTTFEITSSALGAQDALLGGGRYDKLVETLGGKSTPAIGFAAGMERILLAIETENSFESHDSTDIYMVCLDESGLSTSIDIANQMRQNGKSVKMETLRRSMKAQMREANRSGATHAFILGENEIQNKTVVIKNLKEGNQETVSILNIEKNINDLTI